MSRLQMIQCESSDLVRVEEVSEGEAIMLELSEPTSRPMRARITPEEASRIGWALLWAAGRTARMPDGEPSTSATGSRPQG